MKPLRTAGRWIRRHPYIAALVYIGLCVASSLVERGTDHGRKQWADDYMDRAGAVEIQLPTEGLPVRVDPLPYRVVAAGIPRSGEVPVLLLHGTPGGASGFAKLGPELARTGRYTLWLDLPGFASQSEPPGERKFNDYSEKAYAEILWRLLDEMDIERAHIVGWSNGGAAALHMDDMRPGAVASITLLGSVGAQEVEGSGSYFFEHVKYGFGYATLHILRQAVPTFGILGPPSEIHAFLRNFWDTDQRPLGPMMAQTDTPILILHGWHDFLVSDRAAEYHHEIAPTSRLVMLDSDHFMPFLQPVETASIINDHLARHDDPGAEPLTTTENLAPLPDTATSLGAWYRDVRESVFWAPWWALFAIFAAWFVLMPRVSVAVAALLVADVRLDIFLAWTALSFGAFARLGGRPVDSVRTSLRIAAGIMLPFIPLSFVRVAAGGEINVGIMLAGVPTLIALGFACRNLFTKLGRVRIRNALALPLHREFWPAWVFYLPVIVGMPCWTIRRRGLLTFACANPGMRNGGGMFGERKTEIQAGFGNRPGVLRAELIEPGPIEQRLAALLEKLDELGGYPIILKPDCGERGFGIRKISGEADARRALESDPGPLCAQQYHPGPHECGIMWMRDPDDPTTGRIYAITDKVFTGVTGDGESTLFELLRRVPRLRMQMDLFAQRFGDRLFEAPARGETVRLAEAGNHGQGTRFNDGEHLRTPELEETINRIMLDYRGIDGAEMDYGRMDLRYESQEQLARGAGFGLIEINGAFSESTNVYDPDRSMRWAWSVWWRQWRELYRLGAIRRTAGRKPPTFREIFGWWRAHRRRVPTRVLSE